MAQALGMTLALILFLWQGVAFGMALLSTPLAIVAIFVLPVAWIVVAGFTPALTSIAEWVDLSRVSEPLLAGTMSGSDWAHLATASALWVGLPLAIGTWRTLTREVR